MLRSETLIIDGMEFTTTEMVALKVIPLSVRIGKILGPALGELVSENVNSVDDLLKLEIGGEVVGRVVVALMSEISSGEATLLVKDLLSTTMVVVNGKSLTLNTDDAINAIFSGKGGGMRLKDVLIFAAKIVVVDFLSKD